MGQNDPIETLFVRVEGDLRQLLKDVAEGVVLAEDELTKLTFEPKGLISGVSEASTAIREGLSGALQALQQRGQQALTSVREYLSRLVEGFQQVEVATTAAGMSQQRYNQLLAEGSREGASMVQELTALVLRLSESSGLPFETIIDGMRQAKQITTEDASAISQALMGTTESTAGFGAALAKLGVTAAVVGGALKLLLGFVKELWAEIKNATMVSIEYQTSLVRLEVAIRAAQRASGEMIGSIDGWRATLEELRQTYQGLSETDLQAAAARMILVTREMRFNEEQARRTLEAAIQLSTLYQVDLTRATSLVTQGLTGIARGLRLYGVQLSRAILNEEARAQGLRRTWEELTTAERASVALEVITRQLSGTTEDLGAIYGTLGGRLQEAEARSQDAKKEIGTLTAGFKVMGAELKARLLELIARLIMTLERLATMAVATGNMIGTFVAEIDAGIPVFLAAQHGVEAYQETMMGLGTFFGLVREELTDIGEMGSIWETLAAQFKAAKDEMLADLADLAREYGARLADLQADLAARIEAAERKLTDKLVDLDNERTEKRLDAWRAYQDKLADLIRQFQRKREDIERRTAERLANLVDDLNERRAAIMAALYRKLMRLQEDYELASRRSRERFIEDLQDAVANRDAWAAVQLIKRQRREQRELREDYELRARRAREDAEWALANLNSNLEAQRQAILRDRERQLAELQIWLERQREQAAIDYDRRLEDIAIWYARQLREAEIAHENDLLELQRHHLARQLELAAALAEEENITEEGARAIFEQLDQVFGLGGQIEEMMEAFRQRLATRIAIEVQVSDISLPSIPQPAPWLPTLPLQNWPGTSTPNPPSSPLWPDLPGNPTPETVSFVREHAYERSDRLEITISADEHFSDDFEEMVSAQIAKFVGAVIVRPRRI